MQNQLLESLIKNLAMTEHARDLGYRVSDAQIQEAIRSEPAFQIDGKYSPQAARMRLAQAGISLSDLRGADAQRASSASSSKARSQPRTF